MKKINFLLGIIFLLTTCGGLKMQESFENEKVRTTDEFLVEKIIVLPQIMKKFLNLDLYN